MNSPRTTDRASSASVASRSRGRHARPLFWLLLWLAVGFSGLYWSMSWGDYSFACAFAFLLGCTVYGAIQQVLINRLTALLDRSMILNDGLQRECAESLRLARVYHDLAVETISTVNDITARHA